MKGCVFKERIIKLTGLKQAEIARRVDRMPQALNSLFKAEDISSGLIEEFCQVFNIPISKLYEDEGYAAIAGDGSTAVAGYGNNVNDSVALIKAIEEISAQRRVTETAQAQIDKLIELIGKK